MGHMRRICDDHSHMSIYARAAVPAAVRLSGVVHSHSQNICIRETQLRREIQLEAGVAIGLRTQLMPVQVNRGIPVNAVKLHADSLASPIRRGAKSLAIPASAVWEKAPARAGWIRLLRPALDAPIMRQLHCSPRLSLKRGCLRSARIPEQKFPPGI